MNNNFEKQLIKYYMDFLETDFHKQRIPRRRIQLLNSSGSTIGINLSKYDKFIDKINKSFEKDLKNILVIDKKEYTSILENRKSVKIVDEYNKIYNETKEDLLRTLEVDFIAIINDINLTQDSKNDLLMSSYNINVDKFIIKRLIINNINNFKNNNLNEIEINTIENELIEKIQDDFSESLGNSYKIDEILDLANKSIENIHNQLKNILTNFESNDLFVEIESIKSSKRLDDKSEIYISFFDIEYEKNRFPIFYIPIEITSDVNCHRIIFGDQIFLNRKSVEYIIQDINEKYYLENGKNFYFGSIDKIKERIIYKANLGIEINLYMHDLVNCICNYFQIESFESFNFEVLNHISSNSVKLTNSIYLNLFDKSDEAVVNDYEDLLLLLNSDDNQMVNKFNEILNNFMIKDPENFNTAIENAWDQTSTIDKLVFDSPIPLNSDQIQIMHALEKDNCNYINIQGPPGTGKSHTITAIIFNMLLKNKSVLVLSDKKEALDVVEDKLISTLSRVRTDNNFQNPILRLGKSGSTYSKILNHSSIDKLKKFQKVINSEDKNIDNEISNIQMKMRENLSVEINKLTNITIEELLDFYQLESNLEDLGFFTKSLDEYNETELQDMLTTVELLISYRKLNVKEIIKGFSLVSGKNSEDFKTSELIAIIEFLINLMKDGIFQKLESFPNSVIFNNLTSEGLVFLTDNYPKIKNLIGNSFKIFLNKSKIREINVNFNYLFSTDQEIHILNSFNEITELLYIFKNFNKYANIDSMQVFYYLIYIKDNYKIDELILNLNYINKHINILNIKGMKSILNKIDTKNLNTLDSRVKQISDENLMLLKDYLLKIGEFKTKIGDFSYSNYTELKSKAEDLYIYKMTQILDNQVIDFFENSRNTAVTLKEIIQKKMKFPKGEFHKLKQAFPCLLSSIRDYAEYIPFEYQIFDLVIIDEASQVSIAQAFPALLRAKKIIVLGDMKQFSNVKSSQAKTTINNEYMNNLKDRFKVNEMYSIDKLEKLNKFNIRSSVLDFFEYISNFSFMLQKHFRGYKELISYSNKYFYNNSLQVMKIRGKKIDDVLEFVNIEHDGKIEKIRLTNTIEAEYISNLLKQKFELSSNESIGIITPHREQQKYLSNLVNHLSFKENLYSNNKLKIMTFDTCQGEERDLIIYSMVATKENDSLNRIFAKSFDDVDFDSEEGKIRIQRLNVGFSRAKEKMVFILSKDIDDYTGELGNALRFYKQIIIESKNEKNHEDVDKRSAMEPKVLDWIYKTNFWQTHNSSCELIPQFEAGKYLKQQDIGYNHPFYVADFLLIFKKNDQVKKVIIEYDGFKEHFEELIKVDLSNYQDYLKQSDIYRQRVLESYGYKFIRLNRFNIFGNPIEKIDKYLNESIIENNSINTYVSKIKKNSQITN